MFSVQVSGDICFSLTTLSFFLYKIIGLNVSVLVDNLQSVKELEVNKPVFAPENDYLIKNHTQAIVLEKLHESE